jgi:hypothetical protein
MSWLFGCLSRVPISEVGLSEFHTEPLYSYCNNNLYIAAGGNKRLLNIGEPDLMYHFIICGLGISWDCEHILSAKQWDKTLEGYPDSLNKLNGHFCGVIVKHNSVRLITDLLGLRELYLLNTDTGWYFSTRMDWLMKVKSCEIDFSIFASRWLCYNQLSNKSIVKNIIRLNQGASAEIINNKITISNRNWVPEISNPISAEEFRGRLNKLIVLGEASGDKISLSLSGGMDSRVILSILMNSGSKNWNCHTFHTDSPKDSIIAEKMLTDLKIPYALLGRDNHYSNSDLDSLFEYTGTTFMTQSAFNSVKLMNYSDLYESEIIIDGGFGEIWRREYLALLNLRGRKYIEDKNYGKVAEFLRHNKANIFNNDIMSIMREGVAEQIGDIFNILPEADEIGIENWLDLFTIKSRLENFFAPEQARLDNLVTSYMPFAQLSLLNDILNLPLAEKKNNKLFKKIIIDKSPALAKYKLVMGNIYYPFRFSTFQKRLYSKLNFQFIKTSGEKELDKFLLGKKEFIMDSLLSAPVKSYSPYNYEEISEKVNSYYNGNGRDGDYVNWFLTFEVFRQIMGGPK